MPHHVLFIQGAGEGAYAEDALLVERLQLSLGSAYTVSYPAMVDEGNAPYEAWVEQIEDALAVLDGPVILLGHSVGGSVLAKYVAEAADRIQIAGVFLLAAPFWGGDGWRYDGYQELELPPATAEISPTTTPIFLYHCQDDEVVPVAHLGLYRTRLTGAVGRVLDSGGHQFETDLAPVTEDILGLKAIQHAEGSCRVRG